MDPRTLNKYLYIENTPTWEVRALYLFGVIAWLLALYSFSGLILIDPVFRWMVGPIITFLTLYHLSSFFLNLFYRKFDLARHSALFDQYWRSGREPSVDVFLPICGEDISILSHTWKHVSRLEYVKKRVYVLDDSTTPSGERKKLATKYGFHYIERPNKGEMKKAGNMKYAYERTSGEFIVILDADFAPHPDFLIELLPYMSDPKVGIVQSPQFFGTTKRVHDESPLAYGAARAQEIFYRIVQVARDRLGGAHCCGTCAIYRRKAMQSIGGFVQMGHSEDAHTGFALTAKGWIVRYVPIILSVGVCPDNVYSFFHQQHRWCLGNVVMIFDKKFWKARIPFRIKICYLTGFLYNLHFPLSILFSFQLFWTLFIYNDYISLDGAALFYPYLALSIYCLLWFPLSRFRIGVLYERVLKAYSNTHALFSIVFRSSVAWIPTNAKHAKLSSAFRQTVGIVSIYFAAYLLLIAVAVRIDMIHLFDYNYYSIQSWMFYNAILTGILLWQFYRTMEGAQQRAGGSLVLWQMRTAGAYSMLMALLFVTIVFY